MPDIRHDFPIAAPLARVFHAVSTPEGLDQWWTKSSSGIAAKGSELELGFGPGYNWLARVYKFASPTTFEIKLIRADTDWLHSRVGFQLTAANGGTQVRFHHVGWPKANEHYRISTYCWAMYLRVLKRYLEHGETVPYERRLDV